MSSFSPQKRPAYNAYREYFQKGFVDAAFALQEATNIAIPPRILDEAWRRYIRNQSIAHILRFLSNCNENMKSMYLYEAYATNILQEDLDFVESLMVSTQSQVPQKVIHVGYEIYTTREKPDLIERLYNITKAPIPASIVPELVINVTETKDLASFLTIARIANWSQDITYEELVSFLSKDEDSF